MRPLLHAILPGNHRQRFAGREVLGLAIEAFTKFTNAMKKSGIARRGARGA